MDHAAQSKMLLVDKRVIKFKKEYQKILHVSPCFNNSICFLGIRGHRQDCLVHMDQHGNVIKQLIFQDSVDSFAALSQKEVMILETRKNNILVWNLQQDKIINVPFMFKTQETDQSQIYIFPDTNLVCIQQNGRYNNNSFNLSYFRYPLVENQQPLYIYESDEVWTYEYNIRKGNNHSMVCWFKGRHDDGFEFRTFDLRDENLNDESLRDKKLEHKSHKFANDIGKNYPGSPKAEVAMITMWEMTPHKYMLVCISSLSNHIENVNNNYVYNAKDGILRPALFDFGKFNDLNLDQYSFGNTCMFRSFDFENGQPLETPVYYISNETEEIIATETWKCSYLYKYDFSGYDGNLIFECMYENGNVNEITLIPKKIMEPKQINIFFLLQTYNQWDEDLLWTVSELLNKNEN